MSTLAAQFAAFPALEPAEPDTSAMDGRDGAFAHAIYDAAIRRWLTLTSIARIFLHGPVSRLEPAPGAAILAGASQMLLMDRVPVHAAIDQSVEWVKSQRSRAAAGLVNAVLRRIGELREASAPEPSPFDPAAPIDPFVLIRSDGRRVRFSRGICGDDPAHHLAAATSTPAYLIRRWTAQFGAARAQDAAIHGLSDPPITLNVAHADPDRPLPPDLDPHGDPGCRVFSGDRSGLTHLLAARPDIWVQDAASCQAIRSINDLHPGRILDLCAGQGTKTRQIAAAFPRASVVATDQDRARLAVLQAATRHLDHVRIIPIETAEREPAFDLVVLDVPCSNTGVLARRIEARYRADDAQLARLVAVQREILARATSLVRPGGMILYSTCSLEPEENEQAVRFMNERGWRTLRQHHSFPSGAPGQPASEYRDGAFSALLSR